MRRISILLALALVVALTLPAVAEVEEVTVGGSIQVRGQLLTPGVEPGDITINVGALPGDPVDIIIGNPRSFDNDVANLDWVTQRTRVNVDAKLSGGVRGFVELQAFDFWGLSGIEEGILSGTTASDVGNPFGVAPSLAEYQGLQLDDNPAIDLYQAYIEMNDIGDYPIMVRVGRQELAYGREWLVGNNDAGVNFSGLAFDGIKAGYSDDMFSIDAWWARLADFSTPLALDRLGLGIVTGAGAIPVVTAQDTLAKIEEDADIDFYGVYGTYKGLEDIVIEGYWLGLRDARANPIPGTDTDLLHTVGGRIAGVWEVGPGMLDASGEAAAQFGNNAIDGDYGGWAANIMGGYTFTDVQWTPRIEAEYAYFSGDDDPDEDTDTFVRLFSDVHYGELNLGGNLDGAATNLHIIRIGASAVPIEKLTLKGDFYYFMLAEDDDDTLGPTFGLAQDPALGSVDDSPGYELDLMADYQYTEDLNLRVGWAHFFVDDAVEQSWGAGNDDDVDYVYAQATLVF